LSDPDISIGIDLALTRRSEETIERLREVSSVLQELAKYTGMVGTEAKGAQTSISGFIEEMAKTPTLVAESLRIKKGITTPAREEVLRLANELKEAWKGVKGEVSDLDEITKTQIKNATVNLLALGKSAGISEDRMRKLIETAKTSPKVLTDLFFATHKTSIATIEAQRKMKEFRSELSNLSTPAAMMEIRSRAGDILQTYKQMVKAGKEQTDEFTVVSAEVRKLGQSYGYTGQYLKDFEREAAKLGKKLVPQAVEFERIARETRKLTLYQRAYRLEMEKLKAPEELLTLKERAYELIQSYAGLRSGTKMTIQEAIAIEAQFYSLGTATGFTKRETDMLGEVIATQGVEVGKKYYQQLAFIKEKLGELRGAMALYNARLGATGMAVQEFTRRLFWLGLGIMFNYMSISRLMRQQQALNRSAFSVAKTYIQIERLQKEATEATAEYGSTSEEARDANMRLKEAQIGLRFQLEDARFSVQQYYNSMAMLVFGMIPNWLQAGSTINTLMAKTKAINDLVTSSTITQAGAYQVSTTATVGDAVASEVNSLSKSKLSVSNILATVTSKGFLGAITLETIATKLSTVATVAKALAVQMLYGALTMGIGLLVSYAVTTALADQTMKDFEKTVADVTNELDGTSLTDALANTTEKMYGMIDSGKELTRNVQVLSSNINKLDEEVNKLIFPQAQEIIVNQRFIPAYIPDIENKVQIVEQVLEEAKISQVENIIQTIEQELITTNVPVISDQTQLINQILVATRIPSIEEEIQTIRQEITTPTEIPIEDKTQTIRQILIEAEIPRLNDITQIIQQIIQEADITEPKLLVQRIVQDLESVDIQIPEPLQQSIIQELETIDIPEIPERKSIIREELTTERGGVRELIANKVLNIEGLGTNNILDVLNNINKGIGEAVTLLRSGVNVINLLDSSVEGLPIGMGNNMNVTINGPWYIREEADIFRIRDELENIFMKGYFSRGGKI